ncbi:hypothetical protein PR202_ga07757 [Eleusine coracana subsp. coracana]|uniref:RNase H type-1 domain-containing protein n=1 Tax=Eleusine coracana subsp. coracana TaxID=191504 RepID=A0AAV5BYD2_ELECO|nr:hypothetical protein PR202_ga07757 [Eleusine coracana subsp. coracana]
MGAPTSRLLQINIDASFFMNSRSGGWGFIARDSTGEFMEAGAGPLTHTSSALQAEAQAAKCALERVASLGMTRIVLETDATNLALALQSEEMDQSSNGALFKHVRAFMNENFAQCKITVCPRTCNKMADCLASFGVITAASGSPCFWRQAPDFVSALVFDDKPGDGF